MVTLKPKNKNFTKIKDQFQLKNIDINKIVISNKVSFSKKIFEHFNDYKYGKKGRPLCIFLPKMRAFEETLMKVNTCLFW